MAVKSGGITRRDFLKIMGITGILAGVSGVGYKTLKHAEKLALEAADQPKLSYKPNHCGMCPQGCSIMVRVNNGRVERIFGNPYAYVFNRATICARGNMGLYRLYNPDRLVKPLMRVGGERGTWNFKEVSWKEAYNELKKAFQPWYQEMMQAFQQAYQQAKQKGASDMEAMIAGMMASAEKDRHIGSFGWFGCDVYRPHAFAFLIGLMLSNAFSQPIATCFLPKAMGWGSVLGVGVHPEFMVDYDETRLVISVRRNPFGSISISHASRVGQDLRKFKLIVVDPRLSEEAARADMWVPIRPGTDLALLLAMMYVIIKEELYDEDYLRKYSNATMLVDPETMEPLEIQWVPGREPSKEMPYPRPWSVKCFKVYDEATGNVVCNDEAKLPALRGKYNVNGKVYVPVLEALYMHLEAKGYTPEWASKITDIPASTIVEIARLFGTTRPATFDTGWHGTKTRNSFQTWRAMGILNALVGGFGRRGGILISYSALEESKEDTNPAGMPAPAISATKFMAPPWSPIAKELDNYEIELSDGTKTKGPLFNFGRSFIVLDKVIEKSSGWVILNVGANPARTIVDGNDWLEKMLKSKNIAKIVTLDILPQDTALYSDLVLPDCVYLETYDLVRPIEFVPWGGFMTGVPAVDKPVSDCVPYLIIIALLSKDLGRVEAVASTFARLIGIPKSLWGKMVDLFNSVDETYLESTPEAIRKRIEFLGKVQELQIEALALKLNKDKNKLLEEMRTKGAVVLVDKEEVIKENMEVFENHKLYTATGLLEIFSISLWVAAKYRKNGVIKPEWHPIIDWVPPRSLMQRPPEKLGENEFYLIYGKAPTMTHESTANNPILERLTSEMFRRIWIHPSRAEKIGVKEGDLVEVCNIYGKCYKTRVHVTERVRPDTAFIVDAYGHESPRLRFAPKDTVPYNKLIPPEVDPIVGSAVLGDTIVSIRKA
ncbi:MAG: molybdopterin-dependent oxidoreductase [Desulfurococcales archaeon]|nr:molybdopterin-dependent oxidoreductase [Desulfurococcales archaeon]